MPCSRSRIRNKTITINVRKNKPNNNKVPKRVLSKKAAPRKAAVTRARNGGKNTSGSHGYCARYKRAVENPFHPDSRGIKSPDGFMFPTETRALKGKFVMGISSGTDAAAAFICNPVVSVCDVSAFADASAGITTQGSLTQFALNNSIYGGTTQTAMVNQYETYRVVAGGVKLRVVMPELTRTGTVICAPFISTRGGIPYGALNAVGMTNPNMYSNLLGGVLPAVATGPGILELPGAFEMSMNDLGRQDVILPFKPCSAIANTFHSTDDTTQYSATQFLAEQGVTYIAAGITGASMSDIAEAGGWTGWLVYIDGVPASTSNVLNVEYVYHLEGVPSIAAGNASVPVPDSSPTPKVTAVDYGQIMRDIASSPLWSVVANGIEAMGVGSSNPYTIQY